MRVCILLSRIPYPLEKGDKLRAYHQIHQFIEQGNDVHVICLHLEKKDESTVRSLEQLGGKWTFLFLSKWQCVLNSIRAVYNPLPFQVNLYYNRNIKRQIHQIIHDFQPDHIYSQLIRTSEYVKDLVDIPKTLDYMDALSSGLERRSNFSGLIASWFWKLEQKRVSRYERIIYHYFDHTTIISKQDSALIGLPQQRSPVVIPNGIDTDKFHRVHPKPTMFTVLFTGNMNYPPNKDAALFLSNEIMPLVRKKHPDVRLIIAGASPSNEIKQLNSPPLTTITGWMLNINMAYEQANLFVAPMRMGSGMQNKILEAMSMDLPVITSEIASQAFTDSVIEHIKIASTAEEFAIKIIEEIESPSPTFTRNLIQENYNWKDINTRLIELFKS
jgi:glycosyltransferase involved in cell wall biosynthesis